MANRLHTWNAVPFVAFESIKQISTRSCPRSACLSLCLSLSVCACVQNVFDFWPLAGHTSRQPMWNGRLPEISISRKSALLSRHNSMGFICVCHFFLFLFFSLLLLLLLLLFFISPPLPPNTASPSQLFFIVVDPEACRVVAGHLRPLGRSLCVCRQFRASNH